jgi:hypothetical protein
MKKCVILVLALLIGSVLFTFPVKAAQYKIGGATSVTATDYGNGHKLARMTNGTLLTVYKDATRIVLGTSATNGATWGTKYVTAPNFGTRPAIAINSTNFAHIVYENGTRIGYRTYNPTTKALSEETKIGDPIGYSASYPSIAIDHSNVVHVTWLQGTISYKGIHNNIRYQEKSNSGWGAITNLTANSYWNFTTPNVCIDGGDNTYVFYIYFDNTGSALYSNTKNGTGAWSGDIYIDSLLSFTIGPPVSVVNKTNGVGVTYSKNKNSIPREHSITFAASNDTGATWVVHSVYTSTGSLAIYSYPSVSIDNLSVVHLVFCDLSGGSLNYNMLYLYSKDFGITWSESSKLFSILALAGGGPRSPSMLWSLTPTYGKIRSDVPSIGYCFVWTNSTTSTTWYYTNSTIAWTTRYYKWNNASETWNGTLVNTTYFRTLSTWNGTLINRTFFRLISTWNGTIYNHTYFRMISTWNGTIYNSTHFRLMAQWNGTIYNLAPSDLQFSHEIPLNGSTVVGFEGGINTSLQINYSAFTIINEAGMGIGSLYDNWNFTPGFGYAMNHTFLIHINNTFVLNNLSVYFNNNTHIHGNIYLTISTIFLNITVSSGIIDAWNITDYPWGGYCNTTMTPAVLYKNTNYSLRINSTTINSAQIYESGGCDWLAWPVPCNLLYKMYGWSLGGNISKDNYVNVSWNGTNSAGAWGTYASTIQIKNTTELVHNGNSTVQNKTYYWQATGFNGSSVYLNKSGLYNYDTGKAIMSRKLGLYQHVTPYFPAIGIFCLGVAIVLIWISVRRKKNDNSIGQSMESPGKRRED